MWRLGILIFFGIPISICDIMTRRIPNAYVLSMFVASEISLFLTSKSSLDRLPSWDFFHLNLLFLGFLVLAVCIVACAPKVMGMGDVKLLAVLILLCKSPFTWLSMACLATFFGLLWGIITRNRSIPFAPSILLAAILFA